MSIGKPGATLVPGRSSLRDGAVRSLLRIAGLRGALPAPSARMLHRLARGKQLPQTLKKDDNYRLAVLLRGGWIATGPGKAGGKSSLALDPDVRFSLALDEGFLCAEATTTVATRIKRRTAAVAA